MTEATFDLIVGERIRDLRRTAKLSQTDLAQQMTRRGVPMNQPAVTRTERGLRPLRFQEALVVAAALGIPVATLARTATIPIKHVGGTEPDVGAVDIDALRERIERLEAAVLGSVLLTPTSTSGHAASTLT